MKFPPKAESGPVGIQNHRSLNQSGMAFALANSPRPIDLFNTNRSDTHSNENLVRNRTDGMIRCYIQVATRLHIDVHGLGYRSAAAMCQYHQKLQRRREM